MVIRLTEQSIDVIKRHAEETYPEECGGLLLGVEEQGHRVIREVSPLTNVRVDSRHNRVQLDPLAYAKVEREAGRRGLGVWGYYHSHPDHPAVPSAYDLEHAPFIEWSYLIASVDNGKVVAVRAWTVRHDRSRFEEEDLHISEEG